jgi:hypothetical protein
MKLTDLTSSWKLKSFIIEPQDGQKRDWGYNITGLLIYDPSGYMSVSINKDVENDPEENEHQNLFDSILFYSGTYQLEGSTIKHQVTQASNPARIGREMIRYANLEGSTLTLTTPQEAFGRAILIWEKI